MTVTAAPGERAEIHEGQHHQQEQQRQQQQDEADRQPDAAGGRRCRFAHLLKRRASNRRPRRIGRELAFVEPDDDAREALGAHRLRQRPDCERATRPQELAHRPRQRSGGKPAVFDELANGLRRAAHARMYRSGEHEGARFRHRRNAFVELELTCRLGILQQMDLRLAARISPTWLQACFM